jgi:hypothetical protein
MGLIKEPKNVDFTIKSKPWSQKELKDFRKLMVELKEKNKTRESKKVISSKIKVLA